MVREWVDYELVLISRRVYSESSFTLWHYRIKVVALVLWLTEHEDFPRCLKSRGSV